MIFLNSQSIVSKRVSLAVLLIEHDPDVVVVSEIWLSPDISASEFFPSGYQVFRKDRSDGYGGVLLACRDSLNCEELAFDTSAEAVVCKITLDYRQPLIVCSFYRPPNTDTQSIDNLCNLFMTISSTYPNVPTWLVGDLNLPNIDWVNNCTQGSSYPLISCETILKFVQEYGFSQAVNFPTRGKNILDIFITNRPSLLQSCYPIAGISDHEAVYIESSVILTHQQDTQKKSLIWQRADMVAIKEIINQFSDTFLSKFSLSTPVDVLWAEFKQMCYNCLAHVRTNQAPQYWHKTTLGDLSHKTTIT